MSRVTVWKIKKRFQQNGELALRDHKPGKLPLPLSSKFYDLVISTWKRNKCGARKLHAILKKQGFSVSLRKISQVMVKEGFQKPCLKGRKPRKYKRYEWPIPDLMWHTDWHRIKASKRRGEWFISYIDDCSRKIMGYGVFKAATTKNSLLVLYRAIHANEAVPSLLNSDRGSQFIPSKSTRKEKPCPYSKRHSKI